MFDGVACAVDKDTDAIMDYEHCVQYIEKARTIKT